MSPPTWRLESNCTASSKNSLGFLDPMPQQVSDTERPQRLERRARRRPDCRRSERCSVVISTPQSRTAPCSGVSGCVSPSLVRLYSTSDARRRRTCALSAGCSSRSCCVRWPAPQLHRSWSNGEAYNTRVCFTLYGGQSGKCSRKKILYRSYSTGARIAKKIMRNMWAILYSGYMFGW